jgi:hypothetical protein
VPGAIPAPPSRILVATRLLPNRPDHAIARELKRIDAKRVAESADMSRMTTGGPPARRIWTA